MRDGAQRSPTAAYMPPCLLVMTEDRLSGKCFTGMQLRRIGFM